MTSDTGGISNRIHIFVDYWNLQLGMNQKSGARFAFDWEVLPQWLVREATRIGRLRNPSYAGMHVYASYDPRSPGSGRFQGWLQNWLDMQPGVQVILKERRPRAAPRCARCGRSVDACPFCGNPMRGMEEKGIDTAIVTDMIRLAWEDAYDVAILVSSDSDFIPAVEFLDQRGLKVIQAGFPPQGRDLAAPSWASFDLYERRREFERR